MLICRWFWITVPVDLTESIHVVLKQVHHVQVHVLYLPTLSLSGVPDVPGTYITINPLPPAPREGVPMH